MNDEATRGASSPESKNSPLHSSASWNNRSGSPWTPSSSISNFLLLDEFGDLGTNCLEIAQSCLEDAARCAQSVKNFVNKVLYRHEVSLRNVHRLGVVHTLA
jgi:hypothetical protein